MCNIKPQRAYQGVCLVLGREHPLDDVTAAVCIVRRPPHHRDKYYKRKERRAQKSGLTVYMQWRKEIHGNATPPAHLCKLLLHFAYTTYRIKGVYGKDNGAGHTEDELEQVRYHNTPKPGQYCVGQGYTDADGNRSPLHLRRDSQHHLQDGSHGLDHPAHYYKIIYSAEVTGLECPEYLGRTPRVPQFYKLVVGQHLCPAPEP